ncbi:hypothetical protein BABA_04129 [Neobacillus bataviensis LMG 21833]|uniref:Spore germination protein gerPA/gerPF n=1 Tax=Neobacillus bataviensis LMG 21833 TaxID=1117379 RepID=K6DQJ5_9BACI|nr:hypothetical protein [Neobacillus bataviensis]EKN70599.1 hypothetical protein BABA_04129 [Neobacillus bataviensis LMG 21833]
MASPILSPTFHIGTIKIGSIEGASCFSIGNNFIEDFKSNKKHYQGLGNIHGDSNNFSHSTASLTNHEPSPKLEENNDDASLNENSQKQTLK